MSVRVHIEVQRGYCAETRHADLTKAPDESLPEFTRRLEAVLEFYMRSVGLQ